MLKAVFFDLDGTLLPIEESDFRNLYFSLLLESKASKLHYERDPFIRTILDGTKAMILNDGTKTNREVFWDVFAKSFGEDKRAQEAEFDDFYKTDFKNLVMVCQNTEESKNIVDYVNEIGLKAILSTNPIFPMQGQLTRISFIGLKQEDFAYITSYENSCYCKPNPRYFQSLLDRFSLHPDEVLVFGNDDFEDGDCAASLGIKVYLVKNHIIHSPHAKGTYPEIDLSEVKDVIKREFEERKNAEKD